MDVTFTTGEKVHVKEDNPILVNSVTLALAVEQGDHQLSLPENVKFTPSEFLEYVNIHKVHTTSDAPIDVIKGNVRRIITAMKVSMQMCDFVTIDCCKIQLRSYINNEIWVYCILFHIIEIFDDYEPIIVDVLGSFPFKLLIKLFNDKPDGPLYDEDMYILASKQPRFVDRCPDDWETRAILLGVDFGDILTEALKFEVIKCRNSQNVFDVMMLKYLYGDLNMTFEDKCLFVECALGDNKLRDGSLFFSIQWDERKYRGCKKMGMLFWVLNSPRTLFTEYDSSETYNNIYKLCSAFIVKKRRQYGKEVSAKLRDVAGELYQMFIDGNRPDIAEKYRI